MAAGIRSAGRGLAVLADGAQTAFVAGAVAALARAGASWRHGAGVGLGAQVAVLAILGEAEEAARRWRRQGEMGCPLLAPRLEDLRRRVPGHSGALVLGDVWTLAGWLDPGALAEHLAPEAAAVPARLVAAGASCTVLVEDLAGGRRRWQELAGPSASEAASLLASAASFPSGWGPAEERARRWGGVGLLAGAEREWAGLCGSWDIVCGFPVPSVPRRELGLSLLEMVQRRDEIAAGQEVESWQDGALGVELRVVAPSQESWLAFEGRESADLGLEYPLPWERNGELVERLVRYGEHVAPEVVGQ